MSLLKFMKNWVFFRDKLSIFIFVVILIYFIYLVSPFIFQKIIKSQYSTLENRLHKISEFVTENNSSENETVKNTYDWTIDNIYGKFIDKCFWGNGNPCITDRFPFICIRILGHEYPLTVIKTKCGACEENSLIFFQILNVSNITVRSVHNHGEDHNWDEVLFNNSWVIIDPSMRWYDPKPEYYETKRNLNVSYVYAIDQNGKTIDLTDKYTKTGSLKVNVIEDKKSNYSVLVYSNNYVKNTFTGLECNVTQNYCDFNIGGGKYNIVALKKMNFKIFISNLQIVLYDSKKIEIQEGESTEMFLVPRKIHISTFPKLLLLPTFYLIIPWILIGIIYYFPIKLFKKLIFNQHKT